MNSIHYPISTLLFFPILFLADCMDLRAQAELVDRFETEMVIHDIAFRNSLEGYAVADQWIMVTTDGGTTWENTMPLVFRPPFRSIALFGDSGIIIGDMFGGVHVTTSINHEWRSRQLVEGDVTIENPPVVEIEVVDGAHWVAIAGTMIHMTRDSGHTFTATNSPDGRPLTALDVTSAEVMHVSENQGTVLRSTDGGETWSSLNSLTHGFGEIYDVHFISADTGFVASWYPWNLYTTVDGGLTWQTGPFEYPTSISVSPEGPGAYATNQYVRISGDRGMTWTDSVAFPDLIVDGEPVGPFGWEEQKVIVTGTGGIVLLLSAPEQGRSMIARIDVASGVIEGGRGVPDELDITGVERSAGCDHPSPGQAQSHRASPPPPHSNTARRTPRE